MTRYWAWPVAVAVGGGAVLAVFALLYCDAPQLYAAILTGWGEVPFRFPFLDAHAVLSALECTRRGFDTYLLDPCDVMTRAFVYSPMILEAAILPVTIAWDNWVGLALALLFLATVASLPAPRGGREWAVMLLALFSTMSLYAVERGNIDLLILALVVLAGHLMQRNRVSRTGGYGLILFGACLKYYPIVALILALRESPRRFASTMAAVGAILALFLLRYRLILPEAIAHIPHVPYAPDLFGAANLPLGLATLLRWPGAGAVVPTMLLGTFLALLLAFFARQAIAVAGISETFARLDPARAVFLVIGAAVMVGCFVVEQNVGYRGIYFLLILPGLLALARMPAAGRRFLIAALLIVFLMWSEIVPEGLQRLWRQDPAAMPVLYGARVAFWFLRELIWWQVIATLTGLLLRFAADSPVIGAMHRQLPSKVEVGR